MNNRRKQKGIFFTVDAMLSLAMLSILAMAVFAYSQQPTFSTGGALSMHNLAREYLTAQYQGIAIDETKFNSLTGFTVTQDDATIPSSPAPKLVAHAVLVKYGDICCPDSSCSVAVGAGCLLGQPVGVVERTDAWVYKSAS